ncbi:electron transfer flavoprotein subunit alpha/FixB family protein [Labilibaculum sp. DW002]|uniref:Electron transfer flavoprotein subunit alpha/FixB family protein n=1 Tax=Paralabilibaculum antarcticum TaxID=2912572 RepID=A0ABT5VM35_9BACT|nr:MULTISPECIES: electron transfer flavoprotein subunit alpha/FixB family protein [unclassified Labilibaculum]MBI9059440.1 electron transfer flavoprotein subunit alpha/FixB family protein [Labilibaculum sp.]MDE5416498.1 electron transfer flavoprotein subunit alpha/FixB family protein [Labilibaculum sp. DW002]
MSVIAFAKNWNGKFKGSTYELVSYSKKLASDLSVGLVVVSIGEIAEEELKSLGKYGADRIISVNDPKMNILTSRVYADVLTKISEKENASVVVLNDNNSGKAIAPRISVKMKAGMVAAVQELPVSLDPFIVKKRVFSGKAFGHVQIDSPQKVITIAKNCFGLVEIPVESVVEEYIPEVDTALFKVQVLEEEEQKNKVILSDADIVISAGRGMRSPDNWGPVEDLAEVLNAATACSRPVSDEGWRGHEEHVGQTGKVIAPNLYIAAGISGAIQHVAGISRSKCIVAINTDPEAPIFGVADYGIIGDAMEILPRLTEAFRNSKS